MCHKQRYMMCLIDSAMEYLASESKISMWAVMLMSAAISSPPSLPPLLPPGRTWKQLVGASPAEDKSDISETHHTGEAEMFWSVLGKADGNLKKMFLYVLRCHSAWLMDRKAAGGKQHCIRVLLREWRQDLIFNSAIRMETTNTCKSLGFFWLTYKINIKDGSETPGIFSPLPFLPSSFKSRNLLLNKYFKFLILTVYVIQCYSAWS